MIVYGAIRDKLKESGWGRAIKICFFAGLAYLVGMSAFLGVYGSVDTADGSEDVLIILGTAVRGDEITKTLQHRLDEGLRYLRKNEKVLVVVSGGKGPQETVTEASAMSQYLIEHGIAPERILLEESSTSTYENFLFSSQLLWKRFPDGYRCAFVTNGFHCYRAQRLAQLAMGQPCTRLGAKLEWYTWLPNYLRESVAVIKLWVFGQ